MQAGHGPRGRRDRRPPARRRRRWPSSARARSATSSPASRTSARPARARPSPRPDRPAAWRCAGYQRPQADGVLRPLPGRRRRLRRPAGERSSGCASTTRRFTYEPETSGALGFGFRCGFLGLLHMEIVRERLEREFDLALIATAPSRRVPRRTGRTATSVDRRQPGRACRRRQEIESIEEPYLKVTILTPKRVHGHAHGPVPDPAGRDGEAGVPLARARRAASTASRWPRSSSTSSTS